MTEHTQIAQLWLLMLKEGGRWKSPELAEALKVTPAQAMHALNAMATRGYASRQLLPGSLPGRPRYQYGVDAACLVPQGVKVADLLAAGVQP
jgi:predicted ArsR family transcriptional regulator